MTNQLRVIDLDNGSCRTVSWDENVPEDSFETLIETQLRQQFAISDEAWVDLIDLNNSTLVSISKDNLANIHDSVCLCLSSKSGLLAPLKEDEIFEVMFYDKEVGITVTEKNDTVIVHQFKRKRGGLVGAAEASGKIRACDIIYKVAGQRTLGRPCRYTLKVLQTQQRPLSLQFFRPFPREGLYAVEFRTANLNLIVSADDLNIVVTELPMAHRNIIGYAEAHGVRVNDIVHAIDGEIMEGSCQYSRAVSLLSKRSRPLVVIFKRSSIETLTESNLIAVSDSAPTLTSGSYIPRFSFASTAAPSPRHTRSRFTISSRRESRSSVMTSAIRENMLVGDMCDYCDSLALDNILTTNEARILKEMVISTRPDLLCAIRRYNRNAIVAIVRSPAMRLWDHLLKTRESILLAGPVSYKHKRRYHLLLTDHERILIVNKETNLLYDEIMCSHVVTVSSKSACHELRISTTKHDYVLVDNFVGVVVWVRAILPFVCTQGYLKVSTSRRLFSAKRRYFVLRRKQLTIYKKEQMIHSTESKSSIINLKDAVMDILDPKGVTFTITTPEYEKAGKKLIMTASSAREFNKWLVALNFISNTPTHSH